MSKDGLDRAIEIIISNSELGAHQQGTALGPETLLNMLFEDSIPPFPVLSSTILNEVSEQFPNAKNITQLTSNFCEAYTTIRDCLARKKFPFILSGDHSNAVSSIAVFSDEIGRNQLGVIWIDAHADLHTPATTPSGNIHGMPLGAMLNLDVINNMPIQDPKLKNLWDEVKDPGDTGKLPKLKPENLVIIGLRNAEQEEYDIINQLGIKCFRPKDIEKEGINSIFEHSIAHLEHCSKLFVSFDTDSMDKPLVPGTGTPVLNGLSLGQAKKLVKLLWSLPQLAGFDVTEFNPKLDKDNITLQNLTAVFKPLFQNLNQD